MSTFSRSASAAGEHQADGDDAGPRQPDSARASTQARTAPPSGASRSRAGAPERSLRSPSTLPGAVDLNRIRRARTLRRIFLTALAAFILAGLTGMWGVKQRTTTSSASGWTIEMTYAGATRAGLSVPFEWTITKEGGFQQGETVVLRLTDSYFELFDENSFDPTPTSEWTDGEFVYWELETPRGGRSDTMTVSVDTRTGSAVQLTSRKAETAIVVDGNPVVTADLTTWVMP